MSVTTFKLQGYPKPMPTLLGTPRDPVFWIFAIGYLSGMGIILGFELAAFAVNTRYTLSDMTWQWEGIGWTAARYLTFVALQWLAFHLALGWFR